MCVHLQTSRICQRKYAADADFVKRVVKLLYRIGFQSELGHTSVMKMKDQWQRFSTVYCRGLVKKDAKPPRPPQQRSQGIVNQTSL